MLQYCARRAKAPLARRRRQRMKCGTRHRGVPPVRVWPVLAWRLSNTMDTEFCPAALAEALEGYGIPEIFNTDQGQFTSIAFTGLLETTGIRCSMDGRGRCLDNVFIERLWRSLKYEAVYLHDLEDGFEAQRVIGEWMEFYNEQQPHSALAGRTPEEAYRAGAAQREEGMA